MNERAQLPRAQTLHHRSRRRGPRTALVVLVAMAAFTGATACAPQTPPAGGGGIDVNFGPLTIPLPPFELRAPATTIPVLLCNVGYQPPGIRITNATVTIPGVRIDPNNPVITVPNVVVRIPGLRAPLSTLSLACGPVKVPVQVDLILPSTVAVRAVTLNLAARTITLTNPSMTVNGAGLALPLVGDVVVPLPPIVSVPLPSGAIAF